MGTQCSGVTQQTVCPFLPLGFGICLPSQCHSISLQLSSSCASLSAQFRAERSLVLSSSPHLSQFIRILQDNLHQDWRKYKITMLPCRHKPKGDAGVTACLRGLLSFALLLNETYLSPQHHEGLPESKPKEVHQHGGSWQVSGKLSPQCMSCPQEGPKLT